MNKLLHGSSLSIMSSLPFMFVPLLVQQGVRICHRYRTVPYRVRTVFRFFYRTVFYRDRDRYRTVFQSNGWKREAKRTINFDRSCFSILPQTVPHQNGNHYSFIIEDQFWCGTDRGTATKLVQCIDKSCKFLWYGTQREPYRTKTGTVRIAVRFAVLNNKRIMVSILVRYGSRSNTKTRTVKINGSVRFALPTVSLKNGTVTVAIAVKNGTVKKTENGTDTVRYGTDTVRYGTDTVQYGTVRYGHGTVRYGHGTVRER